MSERDKDETDMENFSPREEIEMLLPWFVTGRLDSADTKRVELYLASHPEMEAQLELVRDEMDVSIHEAEKLGAPRAGHLGTLLKEIEASGPSRASLPSGIFTRITNWLGGLEPRQMGFAAMAALALIVVQGITIGGLMRGGGEAPGYETASGPDETLSAKGSTLLIIFNPEAPAREIEKLLGEINGSINSGPKAGGYYQISIGDKPLSDEKLTALIVKLEARKNIISFVARSGS